MTVVTESDIEVDYKDIKERTPMKIPGYESPVEFGVLISFAYPLKWDLGEMVVATTRVETILGDTTIAVHPEDKRYLHLHGKINSNGGSEFEGMPRFKARAALVEALQKKGLYKGAQNNEMGLGFYPRINDVVEPLIRPQWFVNCTAMAKETLDAVMDENNKRIEILLKQYSAEWKRWLENICDWCIS